MTKTRYLVRPNQRLQKLQRDIRKQFGTYKSTYLAKVDGAVRLPNGLFWVHDATGTDANGNTVYGAPRKMPMLPGAAIFPRPNTKVDVVTVQGIDYIARTNSFELERMGVDPHQSNTLDPVVQYKAIDWLINLQAFKTPGASSTHIIGSIYKKPDGEYAVFPTTGGYDFVTANIPSTDMQVVVCQWIDTDTNTVAVTVSSEESRDTDLKHPDNIATTMTLINECVASAPANHIGVNAWRIYDDSTIGTIDDNNKLADLRGIVGGAVVSGGSLDVTDGVTTVTGATAIEFTSGATVTDNAGVAEVAISASFSGDATDVPYTPTDSGDWSDVPTEVGGALDTLAADVAALNAASGNNITVNTYATARPGTPATGDLFIVTDGYWNQEVYDGSAWRPMFDGALLTVPSSSGWSWDNQGSATIDSSLGGLHLYVPAGTSTNSLRLRYRTAPSTPYTITAYFKPNILGATNGYFGFGFRQSSDGKLACALYEATPPTATPTIYSAKFTNATTYSTSYTNIKRHEWGGWLRIADNGTNRILSVSSDGKNWLAFHTVSRTDFLTADQVFFGVAPSSTSLEGAVTLMSWKEA